MNQILNQAINPMVNQTNQNSGMNQPGMNPMMNQPGMNQPGDAFSDIINNLPTNNNIYPKDNEAKLLDNIFPDNSLMAKIQPKSMLLLVVLITAFSLPVNRDCIYGLVKPLVKPLFKILRISEDRIKSDSFIFIFFVSLICVITYVVAKQFMNE